MYKILTFENLTLNRFVSIFRLFEMFTIIY